ncbi:tRNA lysidine(34) synthetase TilS [Fusibacter paucivorans]|uniref:tRNA(Ile)-lysidine synthase n=1 Tax=Fusibacter paucivorans TaxID=76009 RepID=A0ABS5PQ02_9FIRM|nr:tRNA lysidine(34) synthetase TilS [Fusibacter paucivorans]MBS7527243.1 tRNA lysidine(34) synthetase TilS [Fusibacter paucivorans]
MIEQVKTTIEKHQLIKPGDHIVIGVSGGPDSMALLHLLLRLRSTWHLSIEALHVHHGLRGDAADGDLAYVKRFCEAYDVPCHFFKEDIRRIAEQSGTSIEEAGRNVRYHHLEAVRSAVGADSIAVAHHMNDVVETFFINLFRGAGIDGLAAIAYRREPYIIRPLLDVSRQNIEAYCAANGIDPRYDETNQQDIYYRNGVRQKLIPYIKTTFDPNIEQKIYRTTQLFKEEKRFWQNHTRQLSERYVKKFNGGIGIALTHFEALETAEKRHLLRQMIADVRGDVRNLPAMRIDAMIELKEAGKRIDIDDQWLMIRNAETIEILMRSMFDANKDEIVPCIETELLTMTADAQYNRKDCEIIVDADCIVGNLEVRHRKPGDRFSPLGMSGTKKLKDFLIDLKVPQYRRDKLWLVCDAEKIIWIPEYRMSDRVKVTKNTEKLMIIRI